MVQESEHDRMHYGPQFTQHAVRYTCRALPVILVLEQLTVPAGEQVTCLTEELQRLLLVDIAEDGPLRGRQPVHLWKKPQPFQNMTSDSVDNTAGPKERYSKVN